MYAYDKIYIEDAMHNLAVMLDYGAMKIGNAVSFFERFQVSGVSKQFGRGNPKYVVGMSGVELAEAVLCETGEESGVIEYSPEGRSVEYWIGWVLAYLQWHTGLSFGALNKRGVTYSYIASLYQTYHEADISKFLHTALSMMIVYEESEAIPLKRQRKIRNLTQRQLAERTGVSLRMIQAYEQGDQDISRAEARTIIKLAKALDCAPEDLIYGCDEI